MTVIGSATAVVIKKIIMTVIGSATAAVIKKIIMTSAKTADALTVVAVTTVLAMGAISSINKHDVRRSARSSASSFFFTYVTNHQGNGGRTYR